MRESKEVLQDTKTKKTIKKIKRLLIAPWKWCWENLKDWRTAIIFVIVLILVSCEIWVPYLIAGFAYVAGNDALGHSMMGIGSACWAFWLLPGTPFLMICLGLTAGIKAILNKIRNRHRGVNDEKNLESVQTHEQDDRS